MAAPFLARVLNAAESHGANGEPDMEVGDLQQFARDLWAAMTSKQKTTFAGREDWREFIKNWGVP